MARLACIDLPAFPLQLLLLREPSWAERPTVVVAEDKPLAPILWANEHARKLAILPGMKYGAALSLAADLCAGVVPGHEIAAGVDRVSEILHRWSPHVEPWRDDPGVFSLDASGLEPLYASLAAWADEVVQGLSREGFSLHIVVGFLRFSTYALARSRRRSEGWILRDRSEERRAVLRVPLDRLSFPPAARDELRDLGVNTVQQLLALPAEGLRRRCGEEVFRLHRMAHGELALPVQPEPQPESLRQVIFFEEAEANATRLLFAVKQLLHPLLTRLAERGRALRELVVEMKLDGGEIRYERLRPAAPTVDQEQILLLVFLRLEAVVSGGGLSAGVVELAVDGEGTPVPYGQLVLFQQRRDRDLPAAQRAFARLRAEFGERTVVRARLEDGHLPAAQFAWEEFEEPVLPEPVPVSQRPLVRRIYRRPTPLAAPQVEKRYGPYRLAGGWWSKSVARDDYYLLTSGGAWLWAYWDRCRRRWYGEGEVG